MSSQRQQAGFSLIEMAIVMGIIAVLAALAVPSMIRWMDNQRLARSARDVTGAISFARSEAIRTGNVYLVLVQTDAQGNGLEDGGGNPVNVQIVDDGRPTASNCEVDGGEVRVNISLENGVWFGASAATGPVNSDTGGAAIVAGSTFQDAGGNDATWLMFRPEGPTRAFSSDCTVGNVGTGGGGFYLTNGNRDVAVVVTPLGATRVHAWAETAGDWSS